MSRLHLVKYAAMALLFTIPALGRAAEKTLPIGAEAPAWTDLPGVDDAKHSLADIPREKLVLVVFTCNSCPFAVAYEDRIQQFASQYRNKVEVVAINVNRDEEDALPAMKLRAKEKGFSFPYLYDESQNIGRAYGAIATPHFFLLDKERKVAYSGAFDNSRKPERATQHFVASAVDAVLAGKRPEVSSTRPAGCSIRYE
jgi:thiol-disulfide isomerase/thioredoxin